MTKKYETPQLDIKYFIVTDNLTQTVDGGDPNFSTVIDWEEW